MLQMKEGTKLFLWLFEIHKARQNNIEVEKNGLMFQFSFYGKILGDCFPLYLLVSSNFPEWTYIPFIFKNIFKKNSEILYEIEVG